MDFYKILEEILNEQDIGIREASKMCDVSEATLRSIFNRKQKRIALDVAYKLHLGLNVSLERLNGDPLLTKPPVHPRRRKDDPNLRILADTYEDLSEEGKEKVMTYLKDIHSIKKYRRDKTAENSDSQL